MLFWTVDDIAARPYTVYSFPNAYSSLLGVLMLYTALRINAIRDRNVMVKFNFPNTLDQKQPPKCRVLPCHHRCSGLDTREAV